MPRTIVQYLRISTAKQDADAQAVSLQVYAEANGLTVTETTKEVVSGSVPWAERRLCQVINGMEKGDILLVSELSRLGRSVSDVLECCDSAITKGIKIHVAKGGQIIDSSMQSKIWRTIMALTAEIERDFIRMRTAEGLENARAKGTKLGRPKGKMKTHKLDAKRPEIEKLLAADVSYASICRIIGTSRPTFYRWLDHAGINIKQAVLDV
jgi:DNA invertase Pin-like site-specific DNA recombinase